jgi:hypothetical protein
MEFGDQRRSGIPAPVETFETTTPNTKDVRHAGNCRRIPGNIDISDRALVKASPDQDVKIDHWMNRKQHS